MLRVAARFVIAILADTVALIVASLVLKDDMHVPAAGFIVAVLIFAVAEMMVQPMLRQAAIKNMPALLGSTALATTLVSLIVTVIITKVEINGAVTWLQIGRAHV